MSERGIEEIRAEIATERQGLDEDLNALKAELRSLAPFLAACLVVVALVTFRKGTVTGIRLLLRLI